ncbi:hypothetical protein DRN34_03740, partial [Thermococci archaeon]
MSEQDKAAAVAKEADIVIPLRSELPTPAITLDGVWGTIAIFGANLISPAFLKILPIIFQGWDEWRLQEGLAPMHHGVHSIVFRDDGHPINNGAMVEANCTPVVGGIAVNLEHTHDMSVDETVGSPATSVYCNIWYNMLLNITHEMYHLNKVYDDLKLKLEGEKEEETAEAKAVELILFLAQNYDINPGPLADEPYFGPKVLETFQSFMSDAGEEDMAFWKDQQMKALEGIMFWTKDEKTDKDHIFKSFREYMHLTVGSPQDDPAWAKVYEEPAAAVAEPVATEADIEAAKARQKLTEATGDPNWSPPAIDLTQPIPASPTIEINAYTGEESEVHEIDPYVEMAMDDMGVYETPNQVLNTLAVNSPVLNAAGWTPPAPAAPAPTLMPNSSGMAHGLSPAEIGECCMLVYR